MGITLPVLIGDGHKSITSLARWALSIGAHGNIRHHCAVLVGQYHYLARQHNQRRADGLRSVSARLSQAFPVLAQVGYFVQQLIYVIIHYSRTKHAQA